MPIEAAILKVQPETIRECPACGQRPMLYLMRGQVQSTLRRWLRRPYCCIICLDCKKIVGYEQPEPSILASKVEFLERENATLHHRLAKVAELATQTVNLVHLHT